MWKKLCAAMLSVIIVLTAVPLLPFKTVEAATTHPYAVFNTTTKELDFVQSTESHTNKSTGTVKSISGGSYTGTIYDGYVSQSANQSKWHDIANAVKTAKFIDTFQLTNMSYYFDGMTVCTSIDLSHLDTSKVTDMHYMFSDCSSLTSLDVSHFDTSNVIDMNYMFYMCSSLTSLDVSHFDTSKVTDMHYMFHDCRKLTSLDLSHFDTSNVTDTNCMFSGCKSLTSLNVSHFDTSKVIDMHYMFSGCPSLTSLDVSHFDTSNVMNICGMFFGCSSLTSLDVSHFDTSNVMNMNYMFASCKSLTSLDVSHFDTSKVTDMHYMFSSCKSLTSLDVSHFDTSKVIDTNHMFYMCSKLNKLTFGSSFAVPSSKNWSMFPTPTATASGKTSTGDWGLGSELANTTYTADTLATYGTTKVGALAGTWYAQRNNSIVTFNSNGGSGTMATQTITKNTATALNANSFNRTGYTFNGWNTKANGTGTRYADKASVTISSDLTLYAQWKVNSYTVTRQVRYQNADGSWGAYSNIDSKAYNYGSTVPAWNRAADATYKAASITSFTVPAGNVTKQVSVYRNTSTNNSIQARYQNADGSWGSYSSVWSGTLYYGQTHTWSRAADTTYNAASKTVSYNGGTASVNVTRRTYTLTYNGNGGSTPAAVTARYGASWGTLATPTRTGYTFQGWYTAASGGTKFTGGTCSGNQTVYAHWTPNTYTVTYNANDGSGAPNAQNFVFNSGAKLSTTVPTRAGYTFAYWNNGGTHLAPGAAIPNGWGSFTATAVWTANGYTVAFNGNGGTGTMANESMTYDTAKALTGNAFTRSGYHFIGWNTKADGTGTAYTNGASVKNLATSGTVTLYAQWKFVPVVVRVPKAVSYSNMPIGAVNVSASYDIIVDSGNSYTVTVKGTPSSLTAKSGSLNASTISQSAPLVFDKNGTKQDSVHITGTTHTADKWTGAIQYTVSAKWKNSQ